MRSLIIYLIGNFIAALFYAQDRMRDLAEFSEGCTVIIDSA